jgi:hypothetical protein
MTFPRDCGQSEKAATTEPGGLAWLLEARKQFSLQILSYTVTSNQHVYLLVKDHAEATISSAIQLVADSG